MVVVEAAPHTALPTEDAARLAERPERRSPAAAGTVEASAGGGAGACGASAPASPPAGGKLGG